MNNKTFLKGLHFFEFVTHVDIYKLNVLYINYLHENKLKIPVSPGK